MSVLFSTLRIALLCSSMAASLCAHAADAPPSAPVPAPASEPALVAGLGSASASASASATDQQSVSTGRFGRVADESQLDHARGGTEIASDTSLQGSVSGNSASQMTTGANRIDSGSFAGAVGLPVVIQNSGANVLIQNATVINIQLK